MGKPDCPDCQVLLQVIADLEARVRDLEARLNNNASNSSLPPSANPLGAPKPVVKKKSRRRPGGQPGHPPRLKQLLPPERVQHTIPFVPRQCRRGTLTHEPIPRSLLAHSVGPRLTVSLSYLTGCHGVSKR